jgi:hypothetical protein
MVFQAVRTRFPLRIAAGMTELGLLQEPLLFSFLQDSNDVTPETLKRFFHKELDQ